MVKEYAKRLDGRCYVFCEDKNTLSVETAVAGVTGGSFNVNVMSFSRYISSRLKDVAVLSKTASSLAVLRLMNENADRLCRIKPSNRPTLASGVYELIAQLKSAKVKPYELEKICREEGGAFGSKLKDIAVIYSLYEDFLISGNLYDGNGYYDVLPSLISTDENLKGSKVIISGYSSVTRQIIDVFESLNTFCDVDFVLLKGDGEFYTNEIYDRVREIFVTHGIVDDDYAYSPEQLAIEKWLFNPDVYKYTGKGNDKVRILEVASPEKEAETVAKRIRYETVVNGRRYRDFVIATSSPDTHGETYQRAFREYGIPLYVDAKNTMENHLAVRFISGVCDIVRSGYSVDSVLSFSKSSLVCDFDDGAAFERYVAKNAVSRRTIKNPFTVVTKDDAAAERVRKNIMELCLKIKPSAKASDYVSAFKEVLNVASVSEKTAKLSEELSSFGYADRTGYNERVMRAVGEVFSGITAIIGERTLSVSDFKAVLLSAASATEIPIVPLYNDMVYMGDFKSAKQRETKVLFAVSMDSSVPSAKQDTALLTDRDLVRMEGYKCVIEPKIRVVNSRERENVGVALMSFSEKLFLLYPRRDEAGQPSTKSEAVDYIARAFDLKIRIESDAEEAGLIDRSEDFYGYMSLYSGMKRFASDVNAFRERDEKRILPMNAFYSAVKDDARAKEKLKLITGERSEPKLDGDVAKRLSASVIESFFACPYSCYLKYNLKLKEDENGEVQAFEFGNLLHAVLEKFVAEINGCQTEQDALSLGKSIFAQTVNDGIYARYFNKPNYVHIFALVEKEATKRCVEIFNEFKNSEFEPFGEEVTFGNLPNSVYRAIELETSHGKKYISGKVDRVDKFKDYVRIIDYKTGNPDGKIQEAKLYSGNNVQLFLYSNAFLEKFKLAGAYYYKVDDSFSDQEGERKTYVGRTLFDDGIATAMDSRLKSENESVKFGLKFTEKSERTLKESSSTLSERELRCYTEYAKKVSTEGAEEMCDGVIVPSPYEGSCAYCKFGGICGYDGEVEQKTRNVGAVTKSTIARAVEEDDE